MKRNRRPACLLQVNDAVGTLAGARYYDPDVVVAVILGTGSNACYEEREDTSFRLVGPPPASGHMVINIEWGNFNSPLLPVTSYDSRVDKNSPNPGEQVSPPMPPPLACFFKNKEQRGSFTECLRYGAACGAEAGAGLRSTPSKGPQASRAQYASPQA